MHKILEYFLEVFDWHMPNNNKCILWIIPFFKSSFISDRYLCIEFGKDVIRVKEDKRGDVFCFLSFLIHSAHPPLQSLHFTNVVLTSVGPHFSKTLQKKFKFQVKIIITTWRDCRSGRMDHWWRTPVLFLLSFNHDSRFASQSIYTRENCNYRQKCIIN